MRHRLLRALFTLTTLTVVWLVASPARASSDAAVSTAAAVVSSGKVMMSMLPDAPPSPPADGSPSTAPSDAPTHFEGAPLCDPRGATTFAPPPQMQDAEVSLDASAPLDDCAAVSSRDGVVSHRAAPGRAPAPLDATDASDAAVTNAVARLAAMARELVPAPAAGTGCARPGVRGSVDRPPRP